MCFLKKWILFLALSAILSTAVFASGEDQAWKFTVAPYLWAINMNGRVGTGPATLHISETFGDILKQFQGGGMLFMDAQKNKWGLFANAVYAVLSQDVPTAFPATIQSHNHFGIFSLGASYTLYSQQFNNQQSQLWFDPYIGARYTLNNTSLKVTHFSFTDNQHWTDPLIGLRLRTSFNPHWDLILAGDVGGTNLNNHNSYNMQGFVGYKPQTFKYTRFYAGYRLLHQKYLTGSASHRYLWDMKLFGPVVGMAFEF